MGLTASKINASNIIFVFTVQIFTSLEVSHYFSPRFYHLSQIIIAQLLCLRNEVNGINIKLWNNFWSFCFSPCQDVFSIYRKLCCKVTRLLLWIHAKWKKLKDDRKSVLECGLSKNLFTWKKREVVIGIECRGQTVLSLWIQWKGSHYLLANLDCYFKPNLLDDKIKVTSLGSWMVRPCLLEHCIPAVYLETHRWLTVLWE